MRQVSFLGWTFELDGNQVRLTGGGRTYTATYSVGIEDVPDPFWYALLYTLTFDFEPLPIPVPVECDRPWNEALLAFSAGVDSTALYLCLRDVLPTLPVYLDRSFDSSYCRLQRPFVQKVGAVVVANNFERIRRDRIHDLGWTEGAGNVSMLIPLLYVYHARYVALGAVFDEYRGRDVGIPLEARPGSFDTVLKSLGRELILPFAGVTEVVTTRLAYASPFASLVTSCHGDPKAPCDRCPKCLRKQGVLGRRLLMTPSLTSYVNQRPPRQLPTLAYAAREAEYQGASFTPFQGFAVSFCDRYCKPLVQAYSGSLADPICSWLGQHDIVPWSDEDRNALMHLCSSFGLDTYLGPERILA